MQDAIRIVRWRKKYENDFILLNKEWIEYYFQLESGDLDVLGNPEGEIINKGGEIFFALLHDKVIGCCALIHHEANDTYELAKMAVSPKAQGKGAGYLLGTTLIAYARSKGIRHLFLEANTLLESSIRLYHKLGFKGVPMDHPAYSRCNLYMEADIGH